MEVVLLLGGLGLIALAVVIAFAEIRDRQNTRAISGRVIGFSCGTNKRTSPSFHSIAEYVGINGRTYFVEGAIGSSAPLHSVGDSVTVLVKTTDPDKAVLQSSLFFILAGVNGALGLVMVIIFRYTFHPGPYSLVMAAIVLIAAAWKIKSVWRKPALSSDAWRKYKKQIFTPRVFTNETKDQIAWADPISVSVAIQRYEKSQRISVPVLVAIGLAGIFLGYHFHTRTEAFLARSNPTSGHVLRLEEKDPADSGDSSTYAAVVEFRDSSGQTHTFTDSFSSSPPLYASGQTVKVLYDRSNPAAARIDRGLADYWVSIVLYLGGAVFLLMGWSTARWRKARN